MFPSFIRSQKRRADNNLRTADTLRTDDDDWGRAGTLVRDIMNDEQRERLVDNVIGHLLDGVTEPVLQRVFDYFRNVDVDLGDRIEKRVRSH
ncbi:MAG: catalase [Mycobacterium sp.]|nr:catalase [Mycobacterium sp.]